MCKYCNKMYDNKNLLEHEGFKGNIYAYIVEGNAIEIQATDPTSDNEYDANFDINYCPICGRKLVQD